MSQDRDVFSYVDHEGKTLWADPLPVYRAFVGALEGEHVQVLEDARGPEPGGDGVTPEELPHETVRRLQAEGRLAAAGRVAFSLPAVDPQTGLGATDAVCLRALYSFLGWLEKNAGKADSSPTSAPATAPAGSAAP